MNKKWVTWLLIASIVLIGAWHGGCFEKENWRAKPVLSSDKVFDENLKVGRVAKGRYSRHALESESIQIQDSQFVTTYFARKMKDSNVCADVSSHIQKMQSEGWVLLEMAASGHWGTGLIFLWKKGDKE